MPKRIQRKRTKGWQMPVNALYVGRPTEWGNPFVVRPDLPPGELIDEARWYVAAVDSEHAVECFRGWLRDTPDGQYIADKAKRKLHSIDLACWCPLDQPCHADVLLEIANQ